MSQEQSALISAVQCPNCGANVEITPDALAYVCEYCGWVGAIEAVEQKGYLMVKPLPRRQMETLALDFLKRNLKSYFSQATIQTLKPSTIPFWIAQVHAQTRFNGYRQETRTETYTTTESDGRGGTRTVTHTRSYPVYIPVRGTLDDAFTYAVVARKHALFFGLDEISGKVVSAPSEPLSTKALLEEKYEFLDVELDEHEVGAMAETWASDAHRKEAERKTTRLFDCYTQTNVESSKLVLYPVYLVDYEYSSKRFRVTMDAASGKPVKAEFPMTRGLRIGYAAVGYIILIGAVLSTLLLSTSEYAPFAYLTAGLAVISALPLYMATASQRVKEWS